MRKQETQRIQTGFIVTAGVASVGVFSHALVTQEPFGTVDSALLYCTTFVIFVWFTIRYVFLIVKGLPEGMLAIPINAIILLAGCATTHWTRMPIKWLLGMGFLFLMAALKDLEAIRAWTTRRNYQERIYTWAALTRDLLFGLLLTFVGIFGMAAALDGNALLLVRGIVTLVGSYSLVHAVMKGRRVVRLLKR